jgi:hypothetical protein
MKCDEFEAQLNEVLDQRRRPELDESLRLHGELCGGCRQLAAAYGVLFEGLAALPVPQAPADLGARVLEEVQVRPRISLPLAAAAALFSTAAALLVAVSLVGGFKSKPQIAQAPVTPPIASQAKARGPRIEDFKLDLKKWQNVPLIGKTVVSMADGDPSTDPYEEMAKGTGRGLASVVLRMPRVAGPQGVHPPAADGGSVWPVYVSEELRPVTESMTETFNLLIDTLPLTFWSKTRTRDI